MKSNVIKILEVLKSNKVHGKNVEETVVFSAGNELIKDISWREIKGILSKLAKNKIINIESLPYNSILINSGVNPEKDKDRGKRYYKITLLKGFDDYIHKHIGIPEKNYNQECLWISYSDKARVVLLNDVLIIAEPDFDSTNESVFRYLFNNPNRKITIKELEENTKKSITRRLHDIVADLNFKKELKDIFFSVKKTSITFNNPITKQDLIDLGYPRFKIQIL